MREKAIEDGLTKAVRAKGGLCEKWISGTAGWPDRILLMPDGKIGFVEVKAPGRVPRKLQLRRHKKLRNLGFKVYVLDSPDEIGGIINDIQSS